MEEQILLALAKIQADLEELKQQRRSTDWVSATVLCHEMQKRDRWAEVWRKAGLFTVEEGQIRNVGTARAPRYEYNLGACKEQWEWWIKLTDEAKRQFKNRVNAQKAAA